MRKFLLIFTIPCIIFVPFFIYQNASNQYESMHTRKIPDRQNGIRLDKIKTRSTSTCRHFLEKFNLTSNFDVLLLEENVLAAIHKQECEDLNIFKIKIGVNVGHLSEANFLIDHPNFDLIFYTNDTNTDYLDFRSTPRRIIPKNFETISIQKFEIPENIPKFSEFWKRSLFKDCLNLFIPRRGQKVRLHPKKSSDSLAMLRDVLIDFDIYPFLNGGTLLGWYRECSVIPHTLDMDLAVFIDNFNPKIIDHFLSNNSKFKVKRKFGSLNDSLEMTVALKDGYSVNTDIFIMYKDKEENGTEYNYVGGVNGNGKKFRFTYPIYDPWCSADLHGHIFWVTCSPNKQITHEYGKLWYNDHPTSSFIWYQSQKNVRDGGQWTAKEMKEKYKVY